MTRKDIMTLISGPFGTLLVATAAVVALLIWLRRRSYRGPRLHGEEDGINREELEQAEREVRELGSQQRPEGGFMGDDWGPGASRPRPPERL